MLEIASIPQVPPREAPLSIAIGFFDGLHKGHQSVINKALQTAKTNNGEAWVVSFDPHPAHVLRPNEAPPLLLTRDLKRTLLNDLGIHGWLRIPFTRDFSLLSPEQFIDLLRTTFPTLQHVSIGPNWHFGHRATGSPQNMHDGMAPHAIQTHVAKPLQHEGAPISSTRIRQALLQSHPKKATAMLGRPYRLTGRVVHGMQHGRTLGFPTANIAVENECLPGPGIYALSNPAHGGGAGYIPEHSRTGMSENLHIFEAHFYDGAGDLYGETLQIDLLEKIRDDRPIHTETALRKQIQADVTTARQIVNKA